MPSIKTEPVVAITGALVAVAEVFTARYLHGAPGDVAVIVEPLLAAAVVRSLVTPVRRLVSAVEKRTGLTSVQLDAVAGQVLEQVGQAPQVKGDPAVAAALQEISSALSTLPAAVIEHADIVSAAPTPVTVALATPATAPEPEPAPPATPEPASLTPAADAPVEWPGTAPGPDAPAEPVGAVLASLTPADPTTSQPAA